MSNSTKTKYTFILALAFIGIGAWKLYDHFTGVEVETYRVILAGLLVVFGFFQLYRWWKAREDGSNNPKQQ